MKLRSILATDCGSTTTKAILIEFIDGEYRLTYRGEAPTTVEAPFEDVTRGVLNATMEIEELSGRKILDGDNICSPQKGEPLETLLEASIKRASELARLGANREVYGKTKQAIYGENAAINQPHGPAYMLTNPAAFH